MGTFIDSFSIGLDELKKEEITTFNLLKILDDKGRFSGFEASDNIHIAKAMTALMHGPYAVSYTPDSYKGKLEPEGTIGPDQTTYPWVYVRLTELGKSMLEKNTQLDTAIK